MSDVFRRRGTAPDREEFYALRCPRCGSPLVLHQPDPGLPDRLLTVCEDCKSWYVSDGRGARLTPVPIADED